MTVRVNKSSFNIREKLSELGRKFGLKGSELVAAETVQDARDLVSAGRKNLIINGDMRICQRYGFNNPQTVTNQNDYYLDRFVLRENTGGAFQVRQSSPGYPFESAMQINVTTADTSISSSEYARIQYYVEGNDARAIDWGKSDSKDHLTLSFWVKSNAPGDYHVSIENSNNNYYPIMVKKYRIERSDEWQKVVVTFPPTKVYNFHRGTGIGLRITWSLAIGSSYNTATENSWFTSPYRMSTTAQRNFMDVVGNNFYLTGVQLEKGRNATEFEHRPYGEELALCQRYFQGWNATSSTLRAETGIKVYDFEGNSSANQTTTIGTGSAVDSDDARIEFSFPVSMRTKPTPTASDLRLITGSTLHNSSTTIQYNNSTTHHFSALIDNGGGMTAGQCCHLIIKGNGYFYLDAELS